MAIFGKKKKGSDGDESDTGLVENGADNGASDAPAEVGEDTSGFSPQKARTFFDRAQTLHETSSFEYAMQMWLSGLRWDPTSMDGLRGFWNSSDKFVSENPKKKPKPTVEAKGVVGKYIDALMAFGVRKQDTAASIRVAAAAADAGLQEQARTLGRHAMQNAGNEKKPKKEHFVKILDVLEKAEDFQAAAHAGEIACKFDPSDGPLQNRVRNMMAQATMNRGGFESNEEGGFRKNIKDADKQAELEARDTISKSGSVKDSIIARTKAAHEENPDDIPAMEAYCKALVERGRPPDMLKAMSILNKAHKQTGQFRFRQRSGEIQLRLNRRNVDTLRQAAEGAPDDAEAREKYNAAKETLVKQEIEEYKLQVENYPTDLGVKYELGRRLFDQGDFDGAIEQFQLAQQDAKLRRSVQNMMGQALMKIGGWEAEAVSTFRQALEGISDADSEQGMELRYNLMASLQDYARKENDVEAAKEAEKLAGGIAIKSFTYRDIRDRREQIKSLIKDIEANG